MWEAQDTIETLTQKQQYLRGKLKIKGVKFNYHDASTSFLEAVLARGDRRLAPALLAAYQNGAVMDAWYEFFSLERYMEAFRLSLIHILRQRKLLNITSTGKLRKRARRSRRKIRWFLKGSGRMSICARTVNHV